MNLIFKTCTIANLDTLIKISRTTFIDAFEKENDPTDFANYLAKAFNTKQISEELLNPDSTFYFIYVDNRLVGYIKLNKRSAQKESFDYNALELERIYVVKEFQGNKIGALSLKKIIEIAKTEKHSYLWLGVWEQNTRAIQFYQRLGFTKFGQHPYLIGEDKQYDWLMKLDLK